MHFLLFVLITNSLASGSVSSGFGRRIRSVIPTSGRVIEEYSEDFMSSLDPDVRARLARQGENDEENDSFTPMIGNQTHENTLLGMITLGPKFSQGPTSVLFEIVEFPHLLIKYQVDCDDDDIHPILREAWYGDRAHYFGIGAAMVAWSPPVGLCPTSSGKCTTNMSTDEYNECRRDGIGTLRYLITEKIEGIDMRKFRHREYPGGNMGLRDAAIVGLKLFRLLEHLHVNASVVHGDIYPPNVMVTVPENMTDISQVELQLVDFGRAFRVAIPVTLAPIGRKRWFHELCTQWQMEGFIWARRDDVMKTVQTIIELMHPAASFMQHITAIKRKGFASLMLWKEIDRMDVSPSHNPVEILDVPLGTRIRLYKLLDEFLAIARSLRINAPIPYSTMIGILEAIVSTISN